ncbi:hypothetical protein LVQ77_17125 [Buttiauxella sp. S04-F03]|uniref:hypothetical protein n=1 Tax=Buttiauxella sp. W03-F01 TaxID=2904524 RepID=UPI001E4749AA|nr:hypothetical protein [Buttiauxella sp. W03-F01]MCE0802008.1 hypothetical protein [Buttiauxella sp. W03-F01]
MKNRFYLACTRETVGTNMSFHCVNGNGYSTNVGLAHTYTREEAQAAWDNGREIELPVSADDIDALTVLHVDHQYVPGKTTIEPGCVKYVGFVKGQWDGNDLYWLCNGSLPTTDFSKASTFESPTDSAEIVWLPFHLADAVKLRTFNINLLDRRRMIQGAGLKTPDHIKRYKRHKGSSGKVRWNCPCCGKISWQLNPYDFDGCRDISCEEWRPRYEQ